MEKSFFYSVGKTEVEEYQKMLDLMNIPHEVEPPISVLRDGADQYKIVFPDMPVRLYGMVRKLFKGDGKPYSN